jgi:hypothetical protein
MHLRDPRNAHTLALYLLPVVAAGLDWGVGGASIVAVVDALLSDGGRATAGRRLTIDDVDPEWRVEVDAFRDRPAGQSVLRMYREERLVADG